MCGRKKPAHSDDGVVFPGVQRSTWTRDAAANSYYFHRFYEFQPDLNTSNPLVQAELLKIMGLWLQLGVSEFRMDAVPFVIATKGSDVHELVEHTNAPHFSGIPAVATGRGDHPGRGQRASRY